MTHRNRAQVQLVDVVLVFFTLVGLIVLAPAFMTFTNMLASEADPFTKTVLQFTFPLLILALVLSVGISARRGGA